MKTPTWAGLRPTSDRLRETLFNILAPRMAEIRVLDVFAGTGAIALEALSRGAASAVCIENDRRAQALIAENRRRCGEEARCIIVGDDALDALSTAVPGGPFDLVILDPPYDLVGVGAVLTDAAAQRAPNALLVLEHAWRSGPPEAAGLTISRTVRSGDSALSFYA